MKTKIFPYESVNKTKLFDPHLVKYEFRRKIDSRLSNMQTQRKLFRTSGHSTALRGAKPKVFCSNSNSFTAQRATIFTNKYVTTAECLSYIDSAMELQQDVMEAAEITNRAYEIQLLLIFLESFLAFIFNCYYLICVIAEPSGFKLSREESIAYLSQHLVHPCMCVILTVIGFALIRYKCVETQRIVNSLVIHSQDNDIRTRFSAFSQQIQSNFPTFNVYKFFNLDGSVIFSMIAATTTYLIILIQTVGSQSNPDPSVSLHLHQ